MLNYEVYHCKEEKYTCFFVEIAITYCLGHKMNFPSASPTISTSFLATRTRAMPSLISLTTTLAK